VKKIIWGLVVVMLVSLLLAGTSCKAQATTTTTVVETTKAEETTTTAAETTAAETTVAEKVPFVVHLGVRHGFPYRTAIEDTIIATAKEMGIKFQQFDCDLDIQKHFQQLQDAMLLKPDAIIFPILDAKAYVEPVKNAFDKGFKIIAETANIDPSGYPYIKAFVGPDAETQGRLAGELMIDALKAKFGDIKGKKIVIIEGHAGEDAQILRSKGFEDVLKEMAPEVEVLDKQAADWDKQKALSIMEDYLVKYKQIDGLYAQDDPMGVGAIEAIKAAGRLDKIVVIGIGGSKDGIASIKAGEMYGTVLQSPYIGGKLVVEIAVKVAKGEEVEFLNIQPLPKITKENVADYEKDAW